MLGRVGRKFVQRQGEALGHVRHERNVRAAERNLVGLAGAIRRQFLGDERAEIGAVPARVGKES